MDDLFKSEPTSSNISNTQQPVYLSDVYPYLKHTTCLTVVKKCLKYAENIHCYFLTSCFLTNDIRVPPGTLADFNNNFIALLHIVDKIKNAEQNPHLISYKLINRLSDIIEAYHQGYCSIHSANRRSAEANVLIELINQLSLWIEAANNANTDWAVKSIKK